MPSSLEMLGMPARPPRADAARNREHLLCTARRLITEHGVEAVTMDLLASEAGLGKGTIFRRFGSRAGLFRELIDNVEREFQNAMLTGPAPLGPGTDPNSPDADPLERLVAFGQARICMLVHHAPLLRAALAGEHDPLNPVTAASITHVQMLLRRLDLALDTHMLALNLVSTLDVLRHLHLADQGDQLAIERAARGWEELVRAVCAGAPRR